MSDSVVTIVIIQVVIPIVIVFVEFVESFSQVSLLKTCPRPYYYKAGPSSYSILDFINYQSRAYPHEESRTPSSKSKASSSRAIIMP